MTREEYLINRYGQEIIDRFISKIDKTETCWLWTAYTSKSGYGNFCPKWKESTLTAHRFSYTYFKGNIPQEMTVDHICRIRHCVNPDHLRLLTRIENVMIGEGPAAENARKLLCHNGHTKFKEILVKDRKSGKRRYCMECDRIRQIRGREIKYEDNYRNTCCA